MVAPAEMSAILGGAVDPLKGLGDRAYQVTADQVLIGTRGNLMMIRFARGPMTSLRRQDESTRPRRRGCDVKPQGRRSTTRSERGVRSVRSVRCVPAMRAASPCALASGRVDDLKRVHPAASLIGATDRCMTATSAISPAAAKDKRVLALSRPASTVGPIDNIFVMLASLST